MALTHGQIRNLLLATTATHEEEIDCDGFLEALAAYVDLRIEGRTPGPDFVKVQQHERLCANCAEECRAMLDALGASRAL